MAPNRYRQPASPQPKPPMSGQDRFVKPTNMPERQRSPTVESRSPWSGKNTSQLKASAPPDQHMERKSVQERPAVQDSRAPIPAVQDRRAPTVVQKVTPAPPVADARPAWMIARDRLKSNMKNDAENQVKTEVDVAHERRTSKSEGGAAVRHAQVSTILSNLERSSPRDTKSDAGATPPAFFGVKLRKRTKPSDETTTNLDTQDIPVAEVAQEKLNDEQVHHSAQSHPEIKPLTYRERRELELQQEQDSLQQPIGESRQEAPRKLTYKERRELELQKQKDEEAQRQAQLEAQKADKDVANLIKKRIAANKKISPSSAPISPEREEQNLNFRGILKPVQSKKVSSRADETLENTVGDQHQYPEYERHLPQPRDHERQQPHHEVYKQHQPQHQAYERQKPQHLDFERAVSMPGSSSHCPSSG